MSFSIDVSAIFGYASQIVEALMPLIALTAGLAFGFFLIRKITSLFKMGF